MRSFEIRSCSAQALALMLLCLLGALATQAQAQSPVKLRATGALTFVPGETSSFKLAGEASHLGRCKGRGEVTFRPGKEPGALLGTGVADLVAADGDHIVGVVSWTVQANGAGQIHIVWRDSVMFKDGTVAHSTGRFATSRPPGILTNVSLAQPINLLVVIAIIAILIG